MRTSILELPVTLEGDGFVLRETTWGAMHVEIGTFHKKFDATPLLKGLPDDRTPAPQWGYVFKGGIRVTYKDNEEEAFNAGDAFYAAPGHTLIFAAGAECVIFTPEEQVKTAAPVIERNLAAMQLKR